MRKEKNRGFTLIELLVVIGIMGILIAFLFPAIGKSLKGANMAGDLDRLRQIGLALQMYADDRNGQLPPSLSDPDFTDYLDDPEVFAGTNGVPFTTWQGTPASLLPGGMQGAPSENILAFPSEAAGVKAPSQITLDDIDKTAYPPFILVLRGDFVATAMTEEEFYAMTTTSEPGGQGRVPAE